MRTALALVVLLAFAVPATAQIVHLPDHRPLPAPQPPVCRFDLPPGTLCRWQGLMPEPKLLPDCGPGLPVFSECIWKGGTVVQLRTPGGDIAREVALVEGPLLAPVDPRAVRILWHLSISEGWWICETGEDAGSWSADIIADGFCPTAANGKE